jgi:outer membrane receptor protein involved in Fe transport
MAALKYGVSAAFNLGYKDNYTAVPFSGTAVNIPSFWRLDARLGYRPHDWVELFVAGKNLLDPRHAEFADSLEVPRTYYGGLSVSF